MGQCRWSGLRRWPWELDGSCRSTGPEAKRHLLCRCNDISGCTPPASGKATQKKGLASLSPRSAPASDLCLQLSRPSEARGLENLAVTSAAFQLANKGSENSALVSLS